MALVERVLADGPWLARRAVEHVLELVSVVEDPVAQREATQLVMGGQGPRFDLEIRKLLVLEADLRGGDGIPSKRAAQGGEHMQDAHADVNGHGHGMRVMCMCACGRTRSISMWSEAACAHGCGAAHAPPHLNHPPQAPIRLLVRLESHRSLLPLRSNRLQILTVKKDG